MNTKTCATLGFALFLAVGCGPGNTFNPPSIIAQEEAPVINKSTCLPIDTLDVSEADKTTVVLSEELVVSVLNELGGKSYSPTNLWSDLSPESRQRLNFAINTSLRKSRPANYQTIFRATAMFLVNRMGKYLPKHDYRLKDISGKVISFVNPGVQNPSIIDITWNCDFNSGLDLSFIKLPQSLIMPDEVSKLILCRFSEDRHFLLMQARNSILLMSDLKMASANKSEGRLTQSDSKLKIVVNAPEFKLDLNMKKKSELSVNGRISKKTTVDLTMPHLDIKEIGACHEQ